MSKTYPMKCHIRAEGSVTRVDVYDDIGEGDWFAEGISAKSFASQLATVKGPLEVHINSYGGDVSDGIAIGNTIRAHKGLKRTVVDGFACSIASVIMQGGDERIVQPGSMIMVHDALAGCVGNAADMRDTAGKLDKHSENIANIYATRAGGTPDHWRDIMKGETWYTAEEAVAAGLADRVGDQQAELPAGLDLAAFTAVPGRIAARLRTMPQAAATHEPMTGTHSHPHPAYGSQGGDALHAHGHSHDGDANHHHSHAGGDGDGEPGGTPADAARRPLAASGMHGDHKRIDPDGDGDCDACPEGDTDHDYWTAGGQQIQPLPAAVPDPSALTADDIRAIVREELAAAAVDNSPWDASRAWHAGSESDDPAAFYAGICAGKKTGDKATQAAWALPYKYAPGSPPNAAGVRNALSRLPQTQGLTNESEARSLLEGLMKKINPDYDAGDHASAGISGISPDDIRAALRGAFA